MIVHHAACLSTIPKKNLLTSFNNTHKERLYKLYAQPISPGPYPHIAYHVIIFRDGEVVRCREEGVVGYHASNLKANNEGIGICLAFDLNKEQLTIEAKKALGGILHEFKQKYGLTDANIWFHRDFCRANGRSDVKLTNPDQFNFTKNCPGKYLDRGMLEQILHDAEIPHIIKEKEHIRTPLDIPKYYDIEKRGIKLYGYLKENNKK